MKYQLTKEKYLSDFEVAHLNQILTKFPGRDATLIGLALATGARAQELLNLTFSDFDVNERTVFIRGLKGGDDREIPISTHLFNQVLTLKTLDNQTHPFPISYPRLHQIWMQYRPVKKKFHALRHTFAITLYKKCKDIRLLQVALGHKNWNNTMIYAQYQFKTYELRKAILGEAS